MALGNKRRVHASFHDIFITLGNCQKFNGQVQTLGISDIIMRNMRNAFGIYITDLHKFSKAKYTRIASLCVESIPLISSVGLLSANPFFLSQLQSFGKRKIIFGHLGQDKIARPIDDPIDAVVGVTHHAFRDRFNDRDPGTNR